MTIRAGNIKPKTTINFCNPVKHCVTEKTQNCFEQYVLNYTIIDDSPVKLKL
jgi:hypothetical protein